MAVGGHHRPRGPPRPEGTNARSGDRGRRSGSCGMSEGRALLRARQFFGRPDRSADGWNEVSTYARDWEAAYRRRWQHDRVVRSTHGVNCTGSCSWKIHVKDGLVTWETQQTDYPSNGRDTPDYEPRGCPRGASFSWYLYSPLRPKHPYVRGVLLEMYREARQRLGDPVEAWASIVDDPERARAYKSQRGKGGFVRASWEDAAELIAAAHVHTVRRYGPDRIAGFSPIPAMSMVSYTAGTRFLSLIGGVCLSLLRLVRGPTSRLAADLGRPDRCARVRGLVELVLHDPLGLEHPPDPDSGRALHDRGSIQGPEGHRRLARLRRAHQVRGSLAAGQGRHRRRPGDGHGPRGPEGVLRRARGAVLPRLRAPLHGHADARLAARARRRLGGRRHVPALGGPRRHRRQRGVEDGRLGRDAAPRPSRPTARSASAGARRTPGAGTSTSARSIPRSRCSASTTTWSRSPCRDFDGGETEGGTTIRSGVPVRSVGGRLVTTVFDLALAQYGVGRAGSAGRMAARLRGRRLRLHAGLAAGDHGRRRLAAACGSPASSPTTPSAPRGAR